MTRKIVGLAYLARSLRASPYRLGSLRENPLKWQAEGKPCLTVLGPGRHQEFVVNVCEMLQRWANDRLPAGSFTESVLRLGVFPMFH